MEEVVALRASTGEGPPRFFMTWGRVFGAVDPTPLLEAVRPHIERQLGQPAQELSVCDTLREAQEAPYFYEGLLHFAQQRVPYGPDYERWAGDKRSALRGGKELHFLG